MTQAEARLAEFHRRLDEIIAEWKEERESGRVMFYVDIRAGEVMACGRLMNLLQPLTQEKP